MKKSAFARFFNYSLKSASLALIAAALFVGRAQAQCPSFPIAVSAESLANVQVGAVLNIFDGAQPGNFGWLSWTGDPSEPTLVESLTLPGNSSTYINPLNPGQNQLVIGDWVEGKPGVSNSKAVRDALDNLIGVYITVPVWDVVLGEGANATYHISGFATVQILSYQLPGENQISAQFLGFSDCDVISD